MAARQAGLIQEANQVMPGGALGLLELAPEQQRVIDRGLGCHVWDVDGSEYIDYMMGSGPAILGHAHPAITDALRDQIERGTQFYTLTEASIRLASRLVDAIPCAEQVRFVGSGNEATYLAMRLARAATGRDLIMKIEGGFHGTHDYAMMSYRPRELKPFPDPSTDSAGIPSTVSELVLSVPFNDVDVTLAQIQRFAGNLAAVVVEPVFRGIAPEPGFLEVLRSSTAQHGALLIFDEVVTGFRVAWGGAQELFQTVPDLATYGKVIGGGLPVGAVVGARDVMSRLSASRTDEGKQVVSGGTFSGNPLTASAGLAALSILEEPGSFEKLWTLGRRLAEGLRGISQRYDSAFVVHDVGPIVTIFFTDQAQVRDYRSGAARDGGRGVEFAMALLSRGVLVNPHASWFISLAHSESDIDETLHHVDASLAFMSDGAASPLKRVSR